jgi:alpha-L-arabinofuranosidase
MRASRFSLLVAALALLSPSRAASDEAKEATIAVNADLVLRGAIPAELFGANVEWIEGANGMADSEGNISALWSAIARDGGLDHLRWPGGTFSDYYHWREGIGPLAKRPIAAHHTDPASEIDSVGTPGIARWARSFGGGLLITVNAGTGTPEEAADWVKYCEDPGDSRRIADGLPDPLDVGYWEVGNELYLPNNPGSPRVAISAADYAARFLAFAAAMRAALPSRSLRLIAIAEASSSWYPPTDPSWLSTLLDAAAPQIDVVAVHDAYHPMLYSGTEASRSVREVYQALWASPEAVGDSLDSISASLDSAEAAKGLPAGRIGLALTEWGSLFGQDKRWIDQGKTLGSALYIARLFQVFAARDRVRVADAFKLSDSFTQGWVGFDGKAKPEWQVFSLMARQKGFKALASKISGSGSYDTPRVGSVEARSGVSDLASHASLSPDGRTMWITQDNRSWDRRYGLSLSLPREWAGAAASAFTLAGIRVTDNNGPDVRPYIPASLYDEPPGSEPVALKSASLGSDRRVILPESSFVAIELRRRP